MSLLGIYFGSKTINIVETKAKKILNYLSIPHLMLSESELLEEKVPDEIKLVALLKEELRKTKIEAKEAAISLSGVDLIIRIFEMPLLPAEELPNAVDFEAKKYIPFKIEELVSDFQSEVDKISHRNLILFVGIKKETLNKYLSVLNQLNIKASTIEYSAFSILRFLQVSGFGNKGVVGVMSTDFKEEEEANVTILHNGFPLFSRDITLGGKTQGPVSGEKTDYKTILEKLKTELRISLDYYDRKFPNKNLEKIFIISSKDYSSDLEMHIKEMGVPCQAIDAQQYIDKAIPFSLSFIKGYGCSLSKVVKTRLKINLLEAKAKVKPQVTEVQPISIASILSRIKIDFRIVALSVAMCISVYAFGFSRLAPLEKELKTIINARPALSSLSPSSSFEELSSKNSEYKNRLESMNNLIKKQMYLTEQLDSIPQLIPQGLWLANFTFKKEEAKHELILKGLVYLADSDKEFALINTFLSDLKASPAFTKHFKEINIVSIDHSEVKKAKVTNFIISCKYEERNENTGY